MQLPNQSVYSILISSTRLKTTIRAWAPEEFTIGVDSNWEAPFAGVSQKAESVLTTVGVSMQTKAFQTQSWTGTSPITITIPLRFLATSKDQAEKQVITPVKNLMKLVVPGSGAFGKGVFLDPPGPIAVNPLSAFSSKSSKGGDTINIQIGRFLRFKEVIITEVVNTVPMKMTRDNIPLSIETNITFRTHSILTKEDIDDLFLSGS